MNLAPVTMARTKEICDAKHYLGNDLVLVDFTDIPLPRENRRMECIFVGICLSGKGCYTVGTIEHDVKANDVLIIGEGQVLGDIKVTKELSGIGMFVSHEFLYNVMREVRDVTNLFVFSRETPVFQLTSDEVTMFKEYFSLLLLKIGDQANVFRSQIASSIVAAMIYDLCNATLRIKTRNTQRHSRSQEVFADFVKLVEQNFRHERHVSWYSEQLGVSAKTLLEMVKRVSQRTPNEWLDIYTTLEIRLLLKNTTKSIKEIADELHFGTQSSLGKFFKEHVGISPSNYRRR